jgi:hypothetical protein
MPRPRVPAAPPEGITDGESARAKARQLLCEILPEDALKEFLTKGFFHHEGKGVIYRICEKSQTEIYDNGHLSATACLQLSIPAPGCDRMIAEYLILKSDEAFYWNTANVFPLKSKTFDFRLCLVAMLDLALLLKLVLDYLI